MVSGKPLQVWSEPRRRLRVSAIFIIVVVVIQVLLIGYQASRYGGDYRCVEMSRDSERFFESLGIHVYQVSGHKQISGPEGGLDDVATSHRWIILDFGFVSIPFESTALVFFSPEWYGFKNLSISEGYVNDGEFYHNESELMWKKWG